MSTAPILVLKLGGSVLGDELQMRSAVHEVYRWRRAGYRVVAVVSALAGRTDALLARCARLYKRHAPTTEASVAASGELESAALLGLHLDRAGVPCSVITPGAARFRASGHPLDAMPQTIDAVLLEAALERQGVLVFPGYVATNSRGETVVLGRGGSDLTALFLADALQADRCRLIKDVDGLFDRDPATAESSARLYKHAAFEDALATDGSILQHKAIRFAQQVGRTFEVARPSGSTHTQVGFFSSTFRERLPQTKPLKIALLGHGTVGEGVRQLVENLPHLFSIACVVVRSPDKHPDLHNQGAPVLTDAQEALEHDVDVVVETLGGTDAALDATQQALQRGIPVVTANKAVLAAHGPALQHIAASNDTSLLGSAAVGGATPVLETLRSRPEVRVTSVRAVLNGTCNFILNAVAEGQSFADATSEAQRLGFAEACPRRDLEGQDAADKLRVIAWVLGQQTLDDPDIPAEPLTADIEHAARAAGTLRQVATLSSDGSGLRAAIRLDALAAEDPLAPLAAEENAALIQWEDGVTKLVRGAGAGRWPTAEAVLADLLWLQRSGHSSRPTPDGAPRTTSTPRAPGCGASSPRRLGLSAIR